jgi:hypothetical protein
MAGGSEGEWKMNQNDWQPIETAPRDGAWVLGWAYGEPLVVRWLNGQWVETFRGEEVGFDYPTHWMPIPKGPE